MAASLTQPYSILALKHYLFGDRSRLRFLTYAEESGESRCGYKLKKQNVFDDFIAAAGTW